MSSGQATDGADAAAAGTACTEDPDDTLLRRALGMTAAPPPVTLTTAR
jgi:hypothetical protein